MILAADSLAYYLLERGLVTAESAVDGDLVIVEATSRNRNFKVIRRHQPGYFVKQVQQSDGQTIEFLQREANCYWWAANDTSFSALAKLVPAYHMYDPMRHILVVELLPESENLSEYHRRLASFPPRVAARLGEIMGTYHRDVKLRTSDGTTTSVFPRKVPWILSAHQLGSSPVQTLSGANAQIRSTIERYADFHTCLDALREQWTYDCFIHGDMKWENCIVYARDETPDIKVVDWETADFGDACWDVGAIFQAYLTFWIMSIPARSDTPIDQSLELALYPIESMQPAMRAFWLAYIQSRQLEVAKQRDALLRSVGYGAARMLQTAYEYMYHSPQMSWNALALLQVSLNILTDTPMAVSDLLGL